jgi:hypothetical protein
MLRTIGFSLLTILSATQLLAANIPAPTGIPEKHVVELDAPWTTMTTGGSGRYLVFHIKDKRQLALVDVSSGGISKTIEAPGDDLMLAGGDEKLVVIVPSQSIAHRYDIATLKREKSVPLPAGLKPKFALLGSASKGPLYIYADAPVQIIDLETLKPLVVKGEVLGAPQFGNPPIQMTVSGDSKTLLMWSPSGGGESFKAMKLVGNRVVRAQTPGEHLVPGSYMLPNTDSSLYFRNSTMIYDAALKPLPTDHLKDHILLPCDDPQYFLALPCENERDSDAWICASGSLQKIANVKELGQVLQGTLRWDHGHWRFQPRVRWLPTASTMVSLPIDQKTVRLVRADLQELLTEGGGEYLHIVSSPPRVAQVGEPYTYTMQVIASSKKVKFNVESAPAGLKISNDGVIKWTPKTKPVGGTERIIIAVSAGEKEMFHSFEVSVERLVGPSTAKPTPKPAKPTPSKPSGSGTDEPEPSLAPERQASETPVKIDDKRLELPVAKFLVRPGQRGHLLVQEQALTPLGPDGITPEKTIDLKKPYAFVAERSTYYVAVCREPMAVELIDKKTLAVSKSMKFSAMEINDLVLHPTKPVAYVAHKVQASFPRYRFLIYNESTGEGRQSDEYLGESLAIDPHGKFLIAGYSDIFEKGSRLIFNPDQIHVVPTYGGVDWIIRYELDGAGNARPGAMNEKAGGNGRGIRLSHDGKRVTYLSMVGSPSQSGNLTAWDVNDFDKVPVTYPIKGKAATTEFAYHPYLPWVACMGKEGAVILDRDSGDELPGKLNPDEFEGGTLHALWFSADGKALVYDVSVNDIHYLQRIPLKLSADQQRVVDDQFKKSSSSQSLAPSATIGKLISEEKVPLAALHALQGGTGKAMTAKDVAKWFADAVVVVQTPTGNGTGMIVGSDGYILTCGHCVEGAEEIEVSYRRPV